MGHERHRVTARLVNYAAVADVFVSYATQDRERAEQVVHAVVQSGWSVWIDRGLPVRSVAGDEIQEEFSRAKCVVIMWSRSSFQSTWVLNHAREAMKRQAMLPLLIDDVELPPEFAALHTVDLSGWDGDRRAPAFYEVRRGIQRILDSPQGTSPAGLPNTARVAPLHAEVVRRVPDSNPSDSSRRSERRPHLFLCYRRNDTQHAADRLHERLVGVYGADRVFMDVDSVPLGVNFVSYIGEQLRQCAAVLVLIGPDWTHIVDDEGRRRLDDPADHVRVEVSIALRQRLTVIPLLVQDARMPRAKDLPEDIRALADQNGLDMPRAYWKESVERLFRQLDPIMTRDARPRSSPSTTEVANPLAAVERLVNSRDNRRLLICYPEDASLWAARIYDRVVAAHGFRAIFRIKDAQAPGPEYRTLDVSATRAAIVLVTPAALEPDATVERDDEFYATVTALIEAHIPVIPVLVHGATFRAPALHPVAIRPLAAMKAIRLELTDWSTGAKQLLKELQPLMV